MTKLIDIKEMAAQLGISVKTIRNKLSNGTWPIEPVRIDRILRFRQSDIDRLANGEI